MDKKEILERAQSEKVDERETFINDRSMRWTYLIMTLLAGIFTIVRSVREQPIMDLCATVCLSVCAGFMYRYIKNRERFYLIAAVLLAVFGIAAAVRFFMGY